MLIRLVTRAVLSTLLFPALTACMPTIDVRVAQNPGVDLAAYRTFAFAGAYDASHPVQEAVRVELEKRNYVYSAESPDLRVKYAFSYDRIEKGSDIGSRLGDRATISGRLVIDMTDTRANAVVWKGTAEGPLDDEAIKDRAVVAHAVGWILAGVAAL